MAEVVLFHSGYGLRPAVLDWAERLRSAGHRVHTPDLYNGRSFDTLDEATAARDAIGVPELMRRADAAVADLPERVVYAGFSMGAGVAEYLAVSRPGATGLILMHGALPLESMGAASWPGPVDLQMHYADADPLVDAGVVATLAEAARAAGATVDVRIYRGHGHLFADAQLPDYDDEAAARMLQASLEFLDRRRG
jgi:dienelactone hydrolase